VRREGSKRKLLLVKSIPGPSSNSSAMEVRGNQALPTHNKYCPWCNHCKKITQTTDSCWDVHGKPPDEKVPKQEYKGDARTCNMER